jgi:hypothetical protein
VADVLGTSVSELTATPPFMHGSDQPHIVMRDLEQSFLVEVDVQPPKRGSTRKHK